MPEKEKINEGLSTTDSLKSSNLPWVSIYDNIDSHTTRNLEFKSDFKYKIVHPFINYQGNVSIESMHKVEVNLKLCTLHKGKPFGPAYIQYTHPTDKLYSFEGMGLFNDGKLHMGPFTML